MKIPAYILIGLLGILGPALALDGNEMVFKKVELRTDYGKAEGGDNGKICIDANHIRFVDKKDREYFSIPSDAVTDLFYSRVAGRRIGAAIIVSPLLLFSKGKYQGREGNRGEQGFCRKRQGSDHVHLFSRGS